MTDEVGCRTAYRLLGTNADPHAGVVLPDSSVDTQPGPSTAKPILADFPPPPAYEDLAKSSGQTDQDVHDIWEELDDVS